MIDVLIIGQGFAGSILAHELLKEGKHIHIIDHDFESSASAISSGILNPITGRNLVKTWRAESFFGAATDYYKELQNHLKEPIYEEIPIYRMTNTIKEENDYSIKAMQEEYQFVLGEEIKLDVSKYQEQEAFEIRNTKRVAIAQVCALLKKEFIATNCFKNEVFDFSQLQIATDHVVYKDIIAKNIIFCEGAKAKQNPYFSHIPFIIAKGEYLIVAIQHLDQKFILNHNKILVPIGKDQYWFGATFDWNMESKIVTENGLQELQEALEKMVKLPYTIIKRGGAYRPTVKDRRPVLGTHLTHKSLHIFNGFGTKAASLVPYFAKHFAAYLEGNESIEQEVDHARFL